MQMALVSPISGSWLGHRQHQSFLHRSSSRSSRRSLSLRCAYASGSRLRQAGHQPNFYEVLGLSSDVDLSSIKLAYRQLARKYHPDVCPREQLEECTRRFIVLQEAYETLSDSRRRAMYDLALSGALDSHGIAIPYGPGFEDFPDWKMRWADQLSGLKRRSATKEYEKPDSWAARMRRKQQQQAQHQQ